MNMSSMTAFIWPASMANIAQAYARMDVICFPSHYDAPGRPIFEAAFLKVPSIAAVRESQAGHADRRRHRVCHSAA